MKLRIYDYYSAREVVIASFNQKKAKNSQFSVRAWARHLGLNTHTKLLSILSRKKPVPLTYYKALSNALELSKEEDYYFLLLIHLEATEDQFSRMMLLDRIEFIKKHKNLKMKELSNFEVLSDPFFGALIEMTDLKDFKYVPEEISKILRFKRSRSEIEAAVATLVDFGLLTESAGRLQKNQQHVTNVHDLANIGSQKYLRNTALLAAEQVGEQGVESREFNGYALNIKLRDLPNIKEAVRAFIKDFIVQFEAPSGEGDTTYQFNIQLFDLMRKR